MKNWYPVFLLTTPPVDSLLFKSDIMPLLSPTIPWCIRALLIVLKLWLAVMSRLTFELVNDHFNSLGDDDSVVSKKILFKFGFVEEGFSRCF